MTNNIKQIAERLRGLRDALDLSLEDAAKAVELPAAEYEKYESGTSDIPMSFLFAVAQRFGVELTALISGEDAHNSSFFVTRKDRGVSVERVKAYKYQALASGFKNAKTEPFLVTVEPKAANTPMHLNTHPTQEFNLVLEGRLQLQIAGKDLVLETGDSIYFDASLPHGMKALDGAAVKFLAIII
jgi:transcriptional regulator with XRE-family HTH domain